MFFEFRTGVESFGGHPWFCSAPLNPNEVKNISRFTSLKRSFRYRICSRISWQPIKSTEHIPSLCSVTSRALSQCADSTKKPQFESHMQSKSHSHLSVLIYIGHVLSSSQSRAT